MAELPRNRLKGRDRTRSLARIRDSYTCQDCGVIRVDIPEGKKSLDVHHLHGMCGQKSRRYDSIKDLDLLISLCHRCHYHRHDFSERGKKALGPKQKKHEKLAALKG